MGVGLIQLVNVEGDASDNADTIVETWICDWDDVKYGWNINNPNIGTTWSGNSDYICSTIKYNRENQRFYGKDYLGNTRSGIDVVTAQITYKRDWTLEQSAWSIKIASSGYRIFKVLGEGTWGVIQKPCGWQENDYKMPILQYDLSCKFEGNLPYSTYYSYVGKINNEADMPILGITGSRGCVLFESFSIIPNIVQDEIINHDVTLTFKYSMFDWNWEWRNPVQLTNTYDGKPMVWQNKYPNRPDYTQTASLVNTPIWSGDTYQYVPTGQVDMQGNPIYNSVQMGDPAYGRGGWDYRTYVSLNNKCVYDYANLLDLFNEAQSEE